MFCIFKRFVFLCFFNFLIVLPAHAALQHKGTDSYLAGLWHVYSADIIDYKGKKIMFMGGWLVREHTGNDLIYYSKADGSGWDEPKISFRKAGYSVNDPTVIKHPQHDWLFMYYTGLAENHQGNGLTRKNVVGFASSVNGGKSWTDHGIIIGGDNGYNGDGAWSPSAVLSPDESEIWLYYHTNSPSIVVLRTRLNINGWQKVGNTQRVHFYKKDSNGVTRHALQHGRVNIDVDYIANDKLAMVTNEFSLSNAGFYTADSDGISFYEEGSLNPFIAGGENHVLTPTIEVTGRNKFNVFFGFGTQSNTCTDEWRANGQTNINCSNSIHGWEYRYKPGPTSPKQADGLSAPMSELSSTASSFEEVGGGDQGQFSLLSSDGFGGGLLNSLGFEEEGCDGLREREVTCKDHKGRVVSDSYCLNPKYAGLVGPKPENLEICKFACPETEEGSGGEENENGGGEGGWSDTDGDGFADTNDGTGTGNSDGEAM